MSEENRSYYAIIPANVRYDSSLNANAKLLYGEITALCNQEGYCWASNDYFSKLYGVSKTTISRWVKDLKDNNYINIQLVYKEGTKEIKYRYIQICGEGIIKNDNRGIVKNDKDNNTSINNTINNKYNNRFVKPTLKEVTDYCLERKNNIDAENFIDYYEANGWKVGKNPMKDWKAAIRTWERRENATKQPSRTEIVPEWMNKEPEAKPLSPEARKKMEELMKEFKEGK